MVVPISVVVHLPLEILNGLLTNSLHTHRNKRIAPTSKNDTDADLISPIHSSLDSHLPVLKPSRHTLRLICWPSEIGESTR